MAFKLRDDLEKLLNPSQDMAGDRINPKNLESMQFTDGWTIPKDFLAFDESTADAEIDKVTAMAEARAQGSRVLEAYSSLADVELKFQKQFAALQQKLANLEITKAEAHAKWLTLTHDLKMAKRKAGLQHATDVENSNIAFANFDRGLRQRLQQKTNTSRNGTEQGSPALNRRRFSVAS